MELVIGKQYAKKDFGISGNIALWSEFIVHGELFAFFSMVNDKFENIIEEDGFVYEGRGDYVIIPQDVTADLHRHVFVRKAKGEDYTYLGKGLYEKRYDDKRNKIFLK